MGPGGCHSLGSGAELVAAPRRHRTKRARGTHRRGSRLRDRAVVVFLEVDVQLDDAVPVTQEGSSERPRCGSPAGTHPQLHRGRAAPSPTSGNLCLLRGEAEKCSPLQNSCWGRDVALLLQKHLHTWNLLQGCLLWFLPSCLSWSEASPERRAACAPAAGTGQPRGATAPGRQEPRLCFCPQQPARAHTERAGEAGWC